MAKNKKNEQVEEVKEETTAEEKTEQVEESKDDLFTSDVTEKIKVKLLKNIKHNQTRYKIGDTIELDQKDYDSFVKAGIVKASDRDE